MSTRPRGAQRLTATALLAGAALLAQPSTAPALAVPRVAGHTAPAPLHDAQTRARELRLSVDSLRLQAEQAAEAYDEADAQLAVLVSQHLSAQHALDEAGATAGRSDRTADQRVRALYTSGGAPALYATVLQGRDISDVLSRLQSVRAVVGGDRTTRVAAGQSVARRQVAETRLAGVSSRQVRVQAAVAARGDAVRALLARTDALLTGADARLVALAEQQRRAQEDRDARAALAQLERAQRQVAAAALAAQRRAALDAARYAAQFAAQQAARSAAQQAAQSAAQNAPGTTALTGTPLSAGAPAVGLPAADLPAYGLPVAEAPTPGVPGAPALPGTDPGPVAGVPAAEGDVVATAIAAAQAEIGKPYLWGGTGPSGWDCSGLTQMAYRVAGINLPRTSRQQWYAGPHVPLGELAPGDLMFWASDTSRPGSIHHEAMYLGGGLMVAAPHTGAFVRIQPIYLNGYIGAVRPTARP